MSISIIILHVIGIGFLWVIAGRIGYHSGVMDTHKKWEDAFKEHGYVERGKHGDVLSIAISHRGHFWRPSPPDHTKVQPDKCRYKAGGASCVHWCGNEECMK